MGIARVPPTLAPPSLVALARGALAMARPASYRDRLEREVRVLFPRTFPVPFGTGRAALATALTLAMRATGRSVVVLPAYTSFSVAAAAAAAGARVRLCDLDGETLDLDRHDLRSCVDGDTAAVVVANPYGYPSSTWDLQWVRERGTLLVDDAAQALGATDRGQPVGGRGQLGVLSFGRGKCVTTGDGGVLLVHEPDLRSYLAADRPAGTRGLREWALALAVRLSASTIAFGLLSRLPGARVGESSYEPAFPLAAAPASARGLAVGLARAVRRQRAVRTEVAGLWAARLQGSEVVAPVAVREDTEPAYLRFPVIARDREAREGMAAALARCGLPYVRSYPTTLGGIAAFRPWCEERPTPRADALADRLLALPCHAGVPAARVRRAVAVLGGTREPRGERAAGANTLVSSGI